MISLDTTNSLVDTAPLLHSQATAADRQMSLEQAEHRKLLRHGLIDPDLAHADDGTPTAAAVNQTAA